MTTRPSGGRRRTEPLLTRVRLVGLGIVVALLTVSAVLVLSQRRATGSTAPAVSGSAAAGSALRCSTSMPIVCVTGESAADPAKVSADVAPYVELLQEFGLAPATRYLVGASSASAGFAPMRMTEDDARDVRPGDVAASLAAPVSCSSCPTAVRAQRLLSWWLLRQVENRSPAGLSRAQVAWLVSDTASRWVYRDYAAVVACAGGVRIPAPF